MPYPHGHTCKSGKGGHISPNACLANSGTTLIPCYSPIPTAFRTSLWLHTWGTSYYYCLRIWDLSVQDPYVRGCSRLLLLGPASMVLLLIICTPVGKHGNNSKFARTKSILVQWSASIYIYICSAQSRNLRNLEIALHILGIPRLCRQSRDCITHVHNLEIV